MPSLEASLRNLAKARAKGHPPRPWRSSQETRVIKRLAWQWFTYRGPGKWSARAVGSRLGVSHTYIQKLVREFVADPSKIERDVRGSHPATFEQLSRAQEETRQQRERGWLRPPRRWKVEEFKIGDEAVRAVVPTKASTQSPRVTFAAQQDVPLWAKGIPYYSEDNPCDPLVAVKHAMQRGREAQPIPMRLRRRWRPGQRWPSH